MIRILLTLWPRQLCGLHTNFLLGNNFSLRVFLRVRLPRNNILKINSLYVTKPWSSSSRGSIQHENAIPTYETCTKNTRSYHPSQRRGDGWVRQACNILPYTWNTVAFTLGLKIDYEYFVADIVPRLLLKPLQDAWEHFARKDHSTLWVLAASSGFKNRNGYRRRTVTMALK